ncbi:hypothetical protein OZK63_42710, partial [Streptomyces sp. UMAF16]|nr:hypothetical protein [Streptomyces sp. UMAF16]
GLGRQDTCDLWQIVGINPLAPLAKQIAERQKQLTEIHRALKDGKTGENGEELETGKLNLKFPSIFPYSIRG